MKKRLLFIPIKSAFATLSLTLLGVVSSHAALSFYDSFDYTAGELLAPVGNTAGQYNIAYDSNWYDAGPTSLTVNKPPGIANGGLSYEGLSTAGNSVSFDASQIGSARIQIAPTALSSGTVYWSGLLRVNSINTLTTGANGMLLAGFNNTAGYQSTTPSAIGAVLRIRQDSVDSSVYHIGTGMNSGTGVGNVQFDNATSYSEGQTVFVVASYQFVSGTANDVAQMWINPNLSDFGADSAPTPTLVSAPGLADSFTSLLSFDLRNVNTVGAPSVQFDELRVGDTWADVTSVPEPGTGLLGGLGAIAFFFWRQSRKQ
jgi:hypothetical protein